MKKHTAYMNQPGWDVRKKALGCVINPSAAPPVMAPTDLRAEPLPDGWSTMTRLTLENGNTEYLPDFPGSLQSIALNNNKLKELPAIPANVRIIEINKNDLTALPPLPAGLRYLTVKHNQIVTLPNVPPALEKLHITYNQLDTLPSLAGTEIGRLGLGFNNLKALPALPDTVRTLGFMNNQIKVVRNLPDRLRVLNCSNNPLQILEIENLTRIVTLIANNCGLKIIPLLPPPDAGVDEDSRTYYFDNNELSPEFQQIYDTYRAIGWAPGKNRLFRDEVLNEHRRLLRVKGQMLTAMRGAFKGPHAPPGPPPPPGAPGAPLPEPTGAAVPVRRAIEGNYGPANLIARFITGLPGTLEQQRLGILEQREAMGNVPAGTAAAARARIANVAVRPPNGTSNFLQRRAKLYLKKENINAARARYAAEVEAELQRLRIEAEKKSFFRTYGILINELRLRDLESEAESLRFEGTLSANNAVRVEDKYQDIEDILSQFTLTFGQEDTADEGAYRRIRASRGDDEAFKKFLKEKVKSYLWIAIRSSVLRTRDSPEGILVSAAQFPQFYKHAESEELLADLDDIVEKVVKNIFADDEDTDELNRLSARLKKALKPAETNAESIASNAEIAADAAALDAVVGLANPDGEGEEDEAVPVLEVLNNNNDDGLALGIAMAEAAADNAALEAEFAALGENEENNNNQEGGKRRRVTPRNRKHKHTPKRYTRKQK